MNFAENSSASAADFSKVFAGMERTNYSFSGWAESKTGNVVYPVGKEITSSINKNYDLYAKWVENKAKLTYKATTGGSVTKDEETVGVVTGNPSGSTAKPATNYAFDGWYVGDKKVSSSMTLDKDIIDANAKVNGVYTDTTFTAKFGKAYHVYYYQNGQNQFNRNDVYDPNGYVSGASAVAKDIPNYIRDGSTRVFIGWVAGGYPKGLLDNSGVISNTKKYDAFIATGKLIKVGDQVTFANSDIKLFALWATQAVINHLPLTVTYTYDETAPTTAIVPSDSNSYYVGDTVTLKTPASVPGYTFNGWKYDITTYKAGSSFTMPENSVTFTGSFTANTNTKYTVEHYKQNLDDEKAYTLADTDHLTGTTGATTAAVAKGYEGFTAQAFEQQEIAGDGNTVVKIYYTRNAYDVTYAYTGTVPAGASNLPGTLSYKYGASVTVANAATALGYTFHGWTTEDATVTENSFEMPANDVAFTGDFTANTNTKYTVEHYKQNLDDEKAYTLADTDHLTGTTGATTAAVAKGYEGFTAQAFEQQEIAGDGNTVVKIYYTRNAYDVTYAYTGTVPAGASNLPGTLSYKYGASVTVANAATALGYTFHGWYSLSLETKTFTMPANDVRIEGNFTANGDTHYTVNHYKQNLLGTGYSLADTENNLTGATDTEVTASLRIYEGFTFDKNVEGTLQSGFIKGDGSLVLSLYYTRNSYIVSFNDYNGTTIATDSYKYGATVTVPADPTRAADATNTYTFANWTPVVVTTVTGNATYVATYTSRPVTPETPDRPETPETPTRPSTPTTNARPSTPNTGDQTNVPFAAGVMSISMLLAAVAILMKRKYSE